MKKIIAVLMMLLLSANSHSEESVRPSRLLLSAFANQCPQVVTRNVTATLVSLQSLYGTIEELKKDTNCGGAVTFSAAVSRYTSLYQDFETEEAGNQDKVTLEKKIALYTGMLSDSSIDATQANYLQTEIVTSQASLININSNLTRFQNFSGKESRVADQLVRAADDFLTELQTTQGNACYQKNAAKITSILSNALLVTAAFASGGTSLALAGGAVITKSIGKYIGDLKYNNTLGSLQDIEMPTALRCVSQALTDQYCSTNETEELISDRIDSINTTSEGYDGINLLSYQLSPLSNWLEEVYSGSAITSEGDLINREKSVIQAEFLRKTSTYLETYGEIKRKFFLTLSSQDSLNNAIASSIGCLPYLMTIPSLNPCSIEGSFPTTENPIFTTHSRELLPYELYDSRITSVPLCSGDTKCTSFLEFVSVRGIRLSLTDWDSILRKAGKIISDTQNLVNIERSKMLSVDAYSIVVNASRQMKGETSPLVGLKKIVANANRISTYLHDLGCKQDNTKDCEGLGNKYSAEIANIQKTKNLTNILINLINEAIIPRDMPIEAMPVECVKDRLPVILVEQMATEDVLETKSFAVTSCISTLLRLQDRGTSVYFDKIKKMVSYEMEARLLSGDLGDGLTNVINSTKLDLVQSILNSYSTGDSSISLGELEISLESAKNNSKETLNTFFNFFKKNIVESLKSDKLTQTEKNDLCLRILPYVYDAKESFVKDIYPACEKAQFNNYKNGPTIRFSDYVKLTPRDGLRPSKIVISNTQDVTKFFCGYRKYNRANLLIDEQNKQRRIQQRTN